MNFSFTSIILFILTIISMYFLTKELLLQEKKGKIRKTVSDWFLHYPSLPVIIFLGLSLRLFLASSNSFNFDMHIFFMDAQFFSEEKWNIYYYNWNYVYSPAIFFINGVLGVIQQMLNFLPYSFFQRAYICFIDSLTLLLLIKISKKEKISPTRTAVFFFLNPVTIMLSGYHGQFDNNAIFFLLLAVWINFYTNNRFSNYKKAAAWFFLTIGFIIKHIIPFQVFLVEASMFKKNKVIKGGVLFLLTVIAFLATFIPFYNNNESKFVIKEYVLGYQGQATISGITGMIRFFCVNCEIFDMRLYTLYKYLFMAGGMLFSIFLLRRKNLLHSLLLSFLFFLTFSSALSAQYLVLPIAVAALFPSRWFLAYTTLVTIFLLVFQMEVDISIYAKVLLLNIVWLFSSLWFIAELTKAYPPAYAVYTKLVLLVKKGLVRR